MPPNDYSPFKAVVPDGGIATVTPKADPALDDPTIQAYIAEQKAAAEPWSSYLGSIASNAVNTARGFLPTALGGGGMGISDIAKGAVQSAYSGVTLPGDALAGKVQVFDPRTGKPTDEVMRRGADFTGMLTLGAGAIPAEANTLRMGTTMGHPNNPVSAAKQDRVLVVHGGSDFDKIDKAKFGSGEPGGIRPLGKGLYGYVVPLDNPKMAKQAIDGARAYAKKYGKGEKGSQTVHVFSVPKSALLTSNGPIPLEGFPERPLGQPGQMPTPEEVAAFKAESQLYAEKLPSGLIEMSILDPSIAKRVDKFSANSSADNIFSALTGGKRRAEKQSDGFFSRAEEVLLNQPNKSGTAEQFYALLKNAGREKEAKALGLDKLTGPTDVYRLVKQIRANEPRFIEESDSQYEKYTMPGGTNNRQIYLIPENYKGERFIPIDHTYHDFPLNTMFHARLKDDVYTGADGTAKKVLRVEELQSDWSQKGLKNNANHFKYPFAPESIEVKRVKPEELHKYVALDQPVEARKPLVDSLLKQGDGSDYTVARVKGNSNWDILGTKDLTPEQILADAETEMTNRRATQRGTPGPEILPSDQFQQLFYNQQYGIPVGPHYVTEGSKGWVPLAAKRLLIEAAQNGQDEIVIAPGEVHADRWAWNDPGSKMDKGLRTFYDKIVPLEFGKVLKEVEKDSGIKGLKVEAEERPFVVSIQKDRYTPEYQPQLWLNTVAGNAEVARAAGFDHPVEPKRSDFGDDFDYLKAVVKHKDDVEEFNDSINAMSTHFNTLAYKIERGNTFEEAVADTGNDIKNRVETEARLVKGFQEQLNKLEETPYNQLDREDEARIDDMYDRVNTHTGYLDHYTKNLQTLEKSAKLYKYWMDNVQAKNENLKGYVIKLTPELREYILKNGLPRMAKGGIVDLAEMAAHA